MSFDSTLSGVKANLKAAIMNTSSINRSFPFMFTDSVILSLIETDWEIIHQHLCE